MGNDNRALGVERRREYHVHTVVNPLGTNDVVKWVLCSRVALTSSCFGGSERELIYAGADPGLTLHMSCGKET
jgi:hypothetical protein